MKRRGFLGSIGTLLGFSEFERRIMREVGVASPVDVKPSMYAVMIMESILLLGILLILN